MEKNKRKISCLPCRQKKVKCDGVKPHCGRCVRKQCTDACVFTAPGTAGRPPKNAVVNKLVLTARHSSPFCKQFIFENLVHPNYSLRDPVCHSLAMSLQQVFANIFKNQLTMQKWTPQDQSLISAGSTTQMHDLRPYFSLLIADVCCLMLRRLGEISVNHCDDMLMASRGLTLDATDDFFGGSVGTTANPLQSLSPQEALRLIEVFFTVHPCCILINKTMLMQSYWTDTADPLLLSVICGTAMHTTRLLEGKPLCLWYASSSSTRNLFLDYAYTLLHKTSGKATFTRFQAVVLLAHFETMFGYPKRGFALFAVSYSMAAELGGFQPSSSVSNPIETELLQLAVWLVYISTVRGSSEMGHLPRRMLVECKIPFPPMNIHQSASYQFDSANNNVHFMRTYPYILESFYTSAVISHFSCQLLLLLPAMRGNIFDTNKPRPSPPESFEKLESGLHGVLHEFAAFIDKTSKQWSVQQLYTIETVWLLYTIQCQFLRRTLRMMKEKNAFADGNDDISIILDKEWYQLLDPIYLDPADPDVAVRIQNILPTVFKMVDKTNHFLASPAHYYDDRMLAPSEIILSSIEMASRILILRYQFVQEAQVLQYLQTLRQLSLNPIWTGWTGADSVQRLIQDFLTVYTLPDQASFALDTTLFNTYLNTLLQTNSWLNLPGTAIPSYSKSNSTVGSSSSESSPWLPGSDPDLSFLNDLSLYATQPCPAPTPLALEWPADASSSVVPFCNVCYGIQGCVCGNRTYQPPLDLTEI
ncbi:uncharacterized protein BYT42DRAFT_516890 [Radiomyces spectabilis]|uniref:uncharacterized protein n=1 Tax=Radiomyces spectabilis TaxID=64574 RepID=UPI00221E5ACB|nr:uncharacterized protein BYT42DRAFT_516890 [Radiomyces spectabilis]KAI8376129.1 hypothetical protein BYT42DRAFT_516890 [Radiomyces spectabilis]